MVDLPYESLIGISYGLLTGFVPALLVGLAAVGLGIATDRSLPVAAGLATVPVAIGSGTIAGVFDPDPGSAAALSQAYRITMAAIVVGVLGVVATSQGNRIATELPQDRALPIVRGQALSADAIDAVDAMGQVTIRTTGSIREFEGYPSLSPALRRSLATGSWRFPADLQLAELERRLERRLRTAYGLSSVDVSVDGRGRATVAAAPPKRGVATALSDGMRAVTVAGLLPTGIEPGDRVAIRSGGNSSHTDSTEPVQGEVLAISGDTDGAATDRGTDAKTGTPTVDSTATSRIGRAADAGFDGGQGRLTVAVETSDAGRLLEADRYRIAVRSSGETPAFEAAALLSAAGQPVTVREPTDDGGVDGAETLAVHDGDEWTVVADRDSDATAGAATADGGGAPTAADRVFVAGSRRAREVKR